MVLTRTSSRQPSGPGPSSRAPSSQPPSSRRVFFAGAFLVVRDAGADFAATTFCRRGAPGCCAPRPSRIGCEEGAGVALRDGRDLLGRALGDDHAAARPALGTHVDDPVGGLDDVEVVLDHQDGVALVDQAGQHAEQLADVLEVQAGRRLVEDVDGAAGRALLQLAGELDALRLAAGERRRRLAEADVAEADLAPASSCGARSAGTAAKNSAASSIGMSRTSAMVLPL